MALRASFLQPGGYRALYLRVCYACRALPRSPAVLPPCHYPRCSLARHIRTADDTAYFVVPVTSSLRRSSAWTMVRCRVFVRARMLPRVHFKPPLPPTISSFVRFHYALSLRFVLRAPFFGTSSCGSYPACLYARLMRRCLYGIGGLLYRFLARRARLRFILITGSCFLPLLHTHVAATWRALHYRRTCATYPAAFPMPRLLTFYLPAWMPHHLSHLYCISRCELHSCLPAAVTRGVFLPRSAALFAGRCGIFERHFLPADWRATFLPSTR